MTTPTITPPRIACVGVGHWGRNLVRNFHDLGALARICDTDPARRAEFAARYPEVPLADRIEPVLADPEIDAVAIATPAATHGRLVRQALLADKDVLVEKPLCLSVDEGEELVALARDRGRILMVGHLLWYHPAVLALRELVDDGVLGRIEYIYSNRLNLGRIRREENILWSFAPHDISVILGLVGEAPETVHARGGNYLHRRVADVTVSVLGFPSGVKAHIFVSWLHPFKEQKLVVVGDRAMAVFDDLEPTAKLRLYPHAIEWKRNVPVARRADSRTIEIPQFEPLRAECAHFLDCVSTRAEPRTGGAEALAVLRVLDACQRSLEASLDEELRATLPIHAARPAAAEAPHPATAPSGSAGPLAGPGTPFVHESSYIDEDVIIGEGTTIWHFSHVLPHSRIGRGCRIGQNVVIGPRVTIGDGVKIQNNVSVYEGVTLEDHVFCGPSMVFTNVYNPRSEIRRMDELRPTLVRRGATLGANCTIVCGVTIGRYAFVGAGAVVTRDVPDHALVVGNPARVVGWVCACGHRIDFPGTGPRDAGTCRGCGRAYVRTESGVEAAEGHPGTIDASASAAGAAAVPERVADRVAAGGVGPSS